MRQLGACTGNRNSPKLTRMGLRRLTVQMKTIHTVMCARRLKANRAATIGSGFLQNFS
jgi:hypothetical protein